MYFPAPTHLLLFWNLKPPKLAFQSPRCRLDFLLAMPLQIQKDTDSVTQDKPYLFLDLEKFKLCYL